MSAAASPAEGVAYGEPLAPQHLELIVRSGISPAVSAARGYRTVTDAEELRALGFGERQLHTPGLLIPVRNVFGEVVLHQLRPDVPRVNRGKAVKYETLAGARLALDVHPAIRADLADPLRDLWCTEGARKVDAAISRGLCCVGVLGVFGWRGKNDVGGTTVLADWESIALKTRKVYLAFDSDLLTKRGVQQALQRLAGFLESRGAVVRVVRIPPGPDGGKVGLDDFLAAGGTIAQLIATCDAEPSTPNLLPYAERPYGIVRLKPNLDGVAEVPLTNFKARIVEDVVEDDGVEERRSFGLEAELEGRTARFLVPLSRFDSFTWASEHLGPRAVVFAGQGAKDHARAAVQLLSPAPASRRVYRHLGWRQIDGRWTYLHAGGGIDENGARADIAAAVAEPLRHYVLPDPAAAVDLQHDLRACVALLEVASAVVTAPLFAAAFLAPLHETDVTLHLYGETGQFKTAVATLFQQCFGAAFDAKRLPGSWQSTSNALERLAFEAKDALFVVDEFTPTGQLDAPRLHREADRLIRAKANGSGRARLDSKIDLRSAKPPRAVLLSTGEDVPGGLSLRARMVCVEVPRGSVKADRLTQRQADGRAGAYARVMAAFVRWLAPRRDDLLRAWPELRAALRDPGLAAVHRRMPESAADLRLALATFFDFAEQTGGVPDEERERLRRLADDGVRAAVAAQDEHGADAEPAGRFLELTAAALDAGLAHLSSLHDGPPPNPSACGWQSQTGGWLPRGSCIGWTDGDVVYLNGPAALAVAADIGRRSGCEIAVSRCTLYHRLHEHGYLAAVDGRGGKRRFEVRVTINGNRCTVLHLRPGALRGEASPIGPLGPVGPPPCESRAVGEGATTPSSAPRQSQNRPGVVSHQEGGPTGPSGPKPSAGWSEHHGEEP